MAEMPDAEDAILNAIVNAAASNLGWQAKGQALRDLAEAWAWLTSPAQPHGPHAARGA